MIFSHWKKEKDATLNKSLLWDYDLTNFDWYDMRYIVVQRVIERGWFDDYCAAIRIYGGLRNFKKIIKELPILSDKDMSFVCAVFQLKKESLKCYTRKQLRKKLMSC